MTGRLALDPAEGQQAEGSHAALKTSEPNVIIDLSDTAYIDSAALGMLLLARHRAEQRGKTITLQGATGTVLQVLQIANFDRLFWVT